MTTLLLAPCLDAMSYAAPSRQSIVKTTCGISPAHSPTRLLTRSFALLLAHPLVFVLLSGALLFSPALPAAHAADTLQSLVDHAKKGTVVRVPKGIYRETITIDKPVQLIAEPGAEIRGSEIWTDWKPLGNQWVSQLTVPKFPCYGAGSPRSQWPEQAFFDGHPQEQVASDPKSGQFAVDAQRHIILGSNPARHLVEITLRTQWIVISADNVAIEGFRMMHAANPPQGNSALSVNERSGCVIRRNVLSDVHGAAVSFVGNRNQLLDNEITRCGQLGFCASKVKDGIIRGNKINGNNTEDFDAKDWEAGGMKVTNVENMIVENNEFAFNRGPGIWFDINCRRCTISGNRVHHNQQRGIHWEISDGVKIHDNLVWENGWSESNWGWGAGILISSAANAEVYNNVLAWNADGIAVISQARADAPPAVGNFVHDNTIIGTDKDPADPTHNNIYALCFLQDWQGIMEKPGSKNRAENNRISLPPPERGGRFSYPGAVTPTLAAFNQTPGVKGNQSLPESAARAVLKKAGLPTKPER